MIRLHDYWRSGAAYRVRIALNLKGLPCEALSHDLRTGAQRDPSFLSVNPQGLVPALEMNGACLTQSLAIIEWLEERYPEVPLFPSDAESRGMAQVVCCDIHPLNNLRVLNALRNDFGADEAAVNDWIARWMRDGFVALEALIDKHGGQFAFGDTVGLVDCCLVPQVYSADRFEVSLEAFPAIKEVTKNARAIAAFADAAPEQQAGTG
ncbi:MAG: maleylacetoacetate isomerase [Novosphingobium sp.]